MQDTLAYYLTAKAQLAMAQAKALEGKMERKIGRRLLSQEIPGSKTDDTEDE